MANRPGRPGEDYRPEYVDDAKKVASLGATDREIAEFFDISETTLKRWKHRHAEFAAALKVGKDVADDRVEQSLYRRAIGYTFDAVKIMQDKGVALKVPYVEHVPPDTVACIFWLKNRRKAEWRDKIDHEHSGEINGSAAAYAASDAELMAIIAAERKRGVKDKSGARGD